MQHAVFDLLPDVVLAVGLMDFNHPLVLVDGGDVDFWMEVLEGHREDVALVARGAAYVVVAGVVPSADVHTGDEVMGLERGLVVRGLGVTVDVVALRGHLRIVHVAGVVPDLVLVGDPHVAHLVRQEVLHDRLPDAPVIDVGGDAENRGDAVAVADGVETFPLDVGEIDLQVVVAEEIAIPWHCWTVFNEVLAVGVVPDDRRTRKRMIPTVGLDDGHLALVRQIPHLRGLDHGRIGPSRNHVGLDVPLDRALGRPGGYLGSDDEPAVGMVHTAVVQFQIGLREALDGQSAVGIVGTGGEGLAHGIRFGNDRIGRVRAIALADEMLDIGPLRLRGLIVADAQVDITLLLDHRPVRLLGIDSLLVVHDPRLPEQIAGKELDVEARAAQQCLRHRLVQIDGHEEPLLIRLQRHRVGHLVVGIDHWIETREMAAGIREAQRRDDAVAFYLPVQLLRHRLPLPRGSVEANVAVAGHPVSVHQHGDTPLMPLRIEIVERHHVHPILVEVAGRVDVELGLSADACGEEQRRKRHQESFVDSHGKSFTLQI